MRMIILYILGIILLLFIIEYILVCKNCKKANYNNDCKKDVMIILGYPARKDGTLSPILRERIKKAAELYHKGIAGMIICSGGAVANRYIEADVMAQALNELGVAESHIIRERSAKNTYGNLMISKEMMQEKGLETAVIVSSPWHLRKASSYALKLEINHTVEKSKCPHEYLIVGVGIIYLYAYTQMLINHWRYCKDQ